MLWFVAIAIIAIIVWYALAGRAWLKRQAWAQRFFAWIEPLEIALYKKSETILMGRLLWVGGLFVTAYDAVAVFVSSLDLTPITTRILDAAHIPQDMRGLTVTAFIALLGRIVTWLRNRTTKPLEIVSASEADITPEVSVAIAKADIAKDQAVAAVAEAKS